MQSNNYLNGASLCTTRHPSPSTVPQVVLVAPRPVSSSSAAAFCTHACPREVWRCWRRRECQDCAALTREVPLRDHRLVSICVR